MKKYMTCYDAQLQGLLTFSSIEKCLCSILYAIKIITIFLLIPIIAIICCNYFQLSIESLFSKSIKQFDNYLIFFVMYLYILKLLRKLANKVINQINIRGFNKRYPFNKVMLMRGNNIQERKNKSIKLSVLKKHSSQKITRTSKSRILNHHMNYKK